MGKTEHKSDVVVVGGGIAGIVATLELLDHGKSVILFDRDVPERFGGLAKESSGGVFLINTPHQRLVGVKDTPEQALQDWLRYAEFGDEDVYPRQWAEKYVYSCHDDVYRWVHERGVRFFPVVHWVERGLFRPGNSLPRFHLTWGMGYGLILPLVKQLENHPNRGKLEIHFRHRVNRVLKDQGVVTGVGGLDETTGEPFTAEGEATIIASGGICGDIERLRENWYPQWGKPPETILNGSHRYATGELHDVVANLGANVTYLDRQWHYASGVSHPNPDGLPGKGLSLVPPKSGLWLNYRGQRFGPMPLVFGYDTRYTVEQVCRQKQQYSWQIMNWRIAKKELAVAGSEFNDAIREKRLFSFLKSVLLGDDKLIKKFVAENPDFVVARSLEELADKMNEVTGQNHVELAALRDAIEPYDAQIARGRKFHNDDQLRRIAHVRQYLGDRVRSCKFQTILDPKAMPLLAVRVSILSRKTLGGIQTDLESRVLSNATENGQVPIPGLYAVGEAAGFGGGGIHGLRTLEGTFLGSCVLTARTAAQSIAK